MNIIKLTIFVSIIFFSACGVNNGPYSGKKGDIRIGGYYKNGLKDSTWAYYNRDNVKILEENYNMGTLEGKSFSWYDNGKIHTEAEYRDSNLIGILEIWYPNGQINSITKRDSEGLENGESLIWYENGKLKQTGFFKDGQFNGTWKEFYESGMVKSIRNYKDGDSIDLWMYFNEKGDTIKSNRY